MPKKTEEDIEQPSEKKLSGISSSQLVCFGEQLLRVVCTKCLTIEKPDVYPNVYPKPCNKNNRKTLIKSLNGPNYATWKVQCKMAVIKEGLWNI